MNQLCVGIIEPVGGHGGMDYYDYGLALGLGENKVKVQYYTSSETNVRAYPNVETVICFSNMWKNNVVLKSLKYLWGHLYAIRDLKKKGGRLIHLHFFTFRSIDLIILLLAKTLKVRVIVTVHDVIAFDKKANNIIEKECFKYIDGIVVHNKVSFSTLMDRHNLTIPVSIIKHGNYLPFIDKPVPKIKGSSNKKLSLLFFGQIKKVKGLDILLNAVKIVVDSGYDIELVIAGKPWKSDLEEYENLIANLGITNFVKTRFQYIPDTEVSAFYNEADIVILPYRTIYQSGVLLLTLSYGKPVICSDLQAFQEVIVDGFNGLLFQTENASDLAKKIVDVVQQPNLLNTIKDNAFNTISEDYDWIKIGEKTCQFYIDVLFKQ